MICYPNFMWVASHAQQCDTVRDTAQGSNGLKFDTFQGRAYFSVLHENALTYLFQPMTEKLLSRLISRRRE